jgi:hypothetical protein
VTPATLGAALERIGQTQTPLPGIVAVLIGLAALAAVGVQEVWMLARHVNTIAHEGAHAITGSAAGQRVARVTLQPDATGATVMLGGKGGGNLAVGVAGYLGPTAFGLGLAKLIEIGHSSAALWLSLLLLVLLLAVLRSVFSFVPVLATGALIYLVARYGSAGADSVTAYGVAWFLLLSGVRVVFDHGVNAADAGHLARLTHIRPGFWVLVWLAGSIAGLIAGGLLLV